MSVTVGPEGEGCQTDLVVTVSALGGLAGPKSVNVVSEVEDCHAVVVVTSCL